MPAKLRVTPLTGEPFELTIGNTATIGRTSDNIVCLSGSPLVSRQHALVRCHDGYQYQIIDLGSRNGTFVNDQRVVMPMTLAHGARILIAKNELLFEQIEERLSSAHLEVTMAGSMASRLSNPAGGIDSLRYSRFQCDGGKFPAPISRSRSASGFAKAIS
jgi:adenylate cyclase